MTWRTIPIVDDADDLVVGWRSELLDDLDREIAFIEWFFEDGPFYLWCVDPKNMDVLKRVGAMSTLEGAKKRVDNIISGAWSFETRK